MDGSGILLLIDPHGGILQPAKEETVLAWKSNSKIFELRSN